LASRSNLKVVLIVIAAVAVATGLPAAFGRAIGIVVAGRPHALFLVLMAFELLLPPLLVTWQARVARA
jgi:hypothetical protein